MVRLLLKLIFFIYLKYLYKNLISALKSAYNIIADIRKNSFGRDNLHFNSFKFYKTKNGMKKQPWACTKNKSAKCKGTVSTTDVNGTIMMKILVGEHTHGPNE